MSLPDKIRVKMSETVHYEFDIEILPEDRENGSSVEEIAEEFFVNAGPQQEWFSHCEDRTLVDWEGV